jgi:low affinity Fe/Cu permease
MSTNTARGILTEIGTWTSRPAAFVLFAVYAVGMALFAPDELNWHSVATLATWLMTLFIQRAEHRDTQAIQAKLDELIRAQAGASNELTHIDRKEPEEIERKRSESETPSFQRR